MTEATALRWGAWFGDRDLPVRLPTGWQVTTHRPAGGADLGEAGLRRAFANPVESPPLRELAEGRKTAVIVIDDLSRPTPAERLLPLIIEELVAGGIPTERIRIIMGVAAHHPMLRDDIIRKLGRKVAETFTVSNHNVFEGNEYVGKTSAGTPVHINRDFLNADLKLCIGSILPHGGPGFGGGAKLVLPGVAGIETIYQNHRPDNLKERGVNRLEGNVQRADMEEAPLTPAWRRIRWSAPRCSSATRRRRNPPASPQRPGRRWIAFGKTSAPSQSPSPPVWPASPSSSTQS